MIRVSCVSDESRELTSRGVSAIKERIENILAPITCRFRSYWTENRTDTPYPVIVQEFFKFTVNGSYYLSFDLNSYYQPSNSTNCVEFQNNVAEQFQAITNIYEGLRELSVYQFIKRVSLNLFQRTLPE